MNKFKYFSALAVMLAFSVNSIVAIANTISGSYAQSNIQGIVNKANGFNLKYNYEQDSNSLGVISSFTYSAISHSESDIYNKGQYYGFTAGPVFHISNWASIYGIIGAGYGKFQQTVNQDRIHSNGDYGFSYGTGFQFNLIKDIILDISYEHSSIRNTNIGTWVAGIGYRF